MTQINGPYLLRCVNFDYTLFRIGWFLIKAAVEAALLI
jgi:hypothetical protein